MTSASWYACPRVTPSPVIGAGLVDSLLTHRMPWRGRIATYDIRLQKDCGLGLVPSHLALPRIMSHTHTHPRPGGDQLPTNLSGSPLETPMAVTSEDASSAQASFKATRAPANHLIAVLRETLKERQPTKPQPESTNRKIVNVALSHCVLSAAEDNEEEGDHLVCRDDKRLREHEPENLSVFCAENKLTEEQRFGVAAMEDGKT